MLGVVFMTYCVFFELFKREWTREKRQRFWLFYLNSLGGGLVCVNKVESKWGLLLFMFCGVFMDFD